MGLEEHQRRHLFSCYLEIAGLLDEMESIARSGRTAAAPGATMTPLPQGWWERVAAPLVRIRQRLRDLVAREAAEELRAHEAVQPVSASVRWLSLLLLRLGDEVAGLGPERFQRQYGGMPEAMVRELAALQAELERELGQAREELDQPEGG